VTVGTAAIHHAQNVMRDIDKNGIKVPTRTELTEAESRYNAILHRLHPTDEPPLALQKDIAEAATLDRDKLAQAFEGAKGSVLYEWTQQQKAQDERSHRASEAAYLLDTWAAIKRFFGIKPENN
jgi:hypothetical protein